MARFNNYSYTDWVRSALVERVLHDGRKLIEGTGCNRGTGSTTGEHERSLLGVTVWPTMKDLGDVMRKGARMVPLRRRAQMRSVALLLAMICVSLFSGCGGDGRGPGGTKH